VHRSPVSQLLDRVPCHQASLQKHPQKQLLPHDQRQKNCDQEKTGRRSAFGRRTVHHGEKTEIGNCSERFESFGKHGFYSLSFSFLYIFTASKNIFTEDERHHSAC
jgi:hypothetical protein